MLLLPLYLEKGGICMLCHIFMMVIVKTMSWRLRFYNLICIHIIWEVLPHNVDPIWIGEIASK